MFTSARNALHYPICIATYMLVSLRIIKVYSNKFIMTELQVPET
jgi:hypothetical protein